MPRQDVPYGGAICRLKERIAEIWDKLGEKLHSINGVEGDAQGDVKIVSGDAAIVVTSDQVNHEIEIALDSSQLPAAAVSSVNGRTGDVILHSSDIGADGGVSVQGAIDNLSTRVTANASAITSEQLARQNADSTLQTNINTVSAGIPAAAAAAVAADPTVAYINSELNNKIDLSDVSTVETPDTIAKRNGSGRLVAADPASGATDKTLTTANWISQTGSGAPNNLLHTNGDEVKTGVLQLNTNLTRGCTPADVVAAPATNFGVPVMQLFDKNTSATHNILGYTNKVRNVSNQNYLDIANVSYGYTDANNNQQRIDLFLRLLINESNGSASMMLYRQKRNADGSGTVSTKSYTIQTIAFTE